MTESDLVSTYPQLYHVTNAAAWSSIQLHGLLSTSALLDLYRIGESARSAFESERRAGNMTVQRPGWPDVVVRDQSPMSHSALLRCLTDGMTPRDWYRLLNGKVFFWTSEQRLKRLSNARAVRGSEQLILTVATQSLVERYRADIFLSGMNTGATVRKPLPRGPCTFLPIADFPYAERRKSRTDSDALVELTVSHAVPDIMDHLIAAEIIGPHDRKTVWPHVAEAGKSRRRKSDGLIPQV